MTTTLPGRTDGLYAATEDLLREHGVTHRGDVPWALDPLPLVIEARDWQPLEAALIQRTTLLDAILADLTGERKLLTSGLLPAEIIASSPGFLRPAADLRIPGRHQLFCSATDLVRNADGAWTVLSDRTGVPAGLGFAMEDRRVVAQVMAHEYRARRVRRIGPFFRAMRSALMDVAPRRAEAPRVAVLTPGADSSNAFDHAYLATMLGVPLVEGEDLTVEDGRLWTRTLDAREPLDVLVRRVDSAWIDPLELRGDSRLGSPGILHAIREGTLTVVNSIGSGVLESPALFTFLPRLARHLLGEELALPSVATYWCGDRSMGAHVVANIHRLVVRSIHSRATIDARHLSLGQRADLCARIAAQPWAWVGQEPVEPSEAPSLTPDGLVTLPTSFRMFAVTSGDSWTVMAGALGRVGEVGAAFQDAAKDVWVSALEPPPVPEAAEALPGLAPSSVISPRAAEDLYWLGRHLERAEAVARLVRVVADRWDDYHDRTPDDAGSAALDVLLAALHAQAIETPLPRLVYGEEKGTIAHAVGIAHRSARAVPDLMSPDAWPAFAFVERQIAEVRAQHEDGGVPPIGLGAPLSRVIAGLLSLEGVVDETMVRDAGWHLLDLGRRIERAQRVAGTLLAHHDRRHPPEVERLLIESTLLAHESATTYRRRSHAGGITAVWELLLTDAANPRSLAFQLDRVRRALDALPGTRESLRVLLDDAADLLADAPLRWDEVRPDGSRVALAERLRSIQWRLRSLSDEVTRTWFNHPEPAEWSDGGWRP